MRRFIWAACIICISMLAGGCAAGKTNMVKKEAGDEYIEYLVLKESGGDKADIMGILTDLAKKYPDSRQIKTDLLEMHVEWGEYQEAYKYCNMLLLDEPEDRKLLYTRASLEEILGKDPLKTYEKMAAIEPENEYFLSKLADLYGDRGDFKRAAEYFGRYYTLSPRKTLLLQRYVALLFRSGSYDRLVELDSETGGKKVFDELVSLMFALDDIDKCVEFIESVNNKLVKVDKSRFFFTFYYMNERHGVSDIRRIFKKSREDAFFYKGAYHMENSRKDDDETGYDILRSYASSSVYGKEALFYLMKHALLNHMMPELRQYHDIYRNDWDSGGVVLTLLYQAGEAGYDKAGEVLEAAGHPGKDFRRYSGLAELMAVRGKSSFAEDLLARAAELFPGEDTTFLGVKIYSYLEDAAGMKKYYYGNGKNGDKDPAIMNHYGYSLLLIEGYSDEAMSILKRARELDPGDPAIADSLGWAYYLKGDNEIALELISEAYAALPEDMEVLYHMGKVLILTGEEEEGKRLIEQARALDKEGRLDEE